MSAAAYGDLLLLCSTKQKALFPLGSFLEFLSRFRKESNGELTGRLKRFFSQGKRD